ncbi:hypothetical protein D3C74_352720 [compost metagenome]
MSLIRILTWLQVQLIQPEIVIKPELLNSVDELCTAHLGGFHRKINIIGIHQSIDHIDRAQAFHPFDVISAPTVVLTPLQTGNLVGFVRCRYLLH